MSFTKEVLKKEKNIIGLKNILIVKNQEDTIEWIVQNAIRNVKGKLIIIDMGSKDDTWKILEKLKLDNDDIEILKEEDKSKIFCIGEMK